MCLILIASFYIRNADTSLSSLSALVDQQNSGLYRDGFPPLERRRAFVSAGRRRERETTHPSRPPVLRTEMEKRRVCGVFLRCSRPNGRRRRRAYAPPVCARFQFAKIGLSALQQVRKHAHRRAIPAADSCIIQPHDSWSMPAGARFWAAGAVRGTPFGEGTLVCVNFSVGFCVIIPL